MDVVVSAAAEAATLREEAMVMFPEAGDVAVAEKEEVAVAVAVAEKEEEAAALTLE